jgi:hypothetical protein
MIKKIIILIFLVSLYNGATAQSLSDFLKQVSENNPEIQAYRKLLEARKLEARTGFTPSDPYISAGFAALMPPLRKNAVSNTVFSFPTKYLLQKN